MNTALEQIYIHRRAVLRLDWDNGRHQSFQMASLTPADVERALLLAASSVSEEAKKGNL